MYAKILCICLIAAVFPCLTRASSYVPCTTPEDCKTSMKHEFTMEYYDAFEKMLDLTLLAIDYAADVIGRDLPEDDGWHMRLDTIRRATREQIDILKGDQLGDKIVTIYRNTQHYWQQLDKINTQGTDINPQKNRAEGETKKLYKAIFDIWTSAGKLKGDIEVPGYSEIDVDVQKAKDTAITDENMEFIIGTLTRVMNFYELRELNVFTCK